MNKQTQKQWIRKKLIDKGFITRNQCLRNGITRLSSRIWDLRNEGLEIETERIDLGNNRYDYKYILKAKP